MKQTVKVENMACAGCANTVKQRFSGLPEVKNVVIDLDNNKAQLETDERISKKVLQTALEGTNYSVAE